jgi:hypothetical protein
MTSVQDVARDFTALLRSGQFAAAGEKYWSSDVRCIEPGGVSAPVSGKAATRNVCAGRFGACRIDDLGIDGPFVTGNQFALFLDMLIVDSASGQATPFTEIAVFTVRDGQISEERYFYD